MADIAIVTDSSARFSRQGIVHQHNIRVLPNVIEIGRHRWREDTDFVLEDMLRVMTDPQLVPRVFAPSEEEFAATYRQLARSHRGILSIHPSRDLSASFNNARNAAQQVTSTSCPVVALDSRTICAAQGLVVKLAAELASANTPLEALIEKVRTALERVYSIYYVETLEYLRRNAIITDSRAALGSLLGIKPLVTMEDGQLRVTEKVRTRSQAVEQVVEFLMEFDAVEDTVILQSRPGITDQTRVIQDRISSEFVGQHFAFTTYCAAIAAQLGPDAAGVVVLESEFEYQDDLPED